MITKLRSREIAPWKIAYKWKSTSKNLTSFLSIKQQLLLFLWSTIKQQLPAAFFQGRRTGRKPKRKGKLQQQRSSGRGHGYPQDHQQNNHSGKRGLAKSKSKVNVETFFRKPISTPISLAVVMIELRISLPNPYPSIWGCSWLTCLDGIFSCSH